MSRHDHYLFQHQFASAGVRPPRPLLFFDHATYGPRPPLPFPCAGAPVGGWVWNVGCLSPTTTTWAPPLTLRGRGAGRGAAAAAAQWRHERATCTTTNRTHTEQHIANMHTIPSDTYTLHTTLHSTVIQNTTRCYAFHNKERQKQKMKENLRKKLKNIQEKM